MQSTQDRYGEIQAFVAVATHGGITAGAAVLQLTPSAVTRRLQALEARLGVRLLERTTRQVRLTEAGALYFERSREWLADLEAADQALVDWQGQVRGRLHASVPSNFGRLHVMPVLPELLAKYPQLDLDLDFSDRYQDLLAGGFDVAIRIGRLTDSGLVARKLADNRRLLVASPAYLARHGTPQHPRDLATHCCLHFSYYADGDSWRFERHGETVEVPIAGRLRANHGEALYEAALAGFGIMQNATFLVGPALRDGRLVEVLRDWRITPSAIYAVYPSGRFLAPKIRAFVDFFAERFAKPRWEPDR